MSDSLDFSQFPNIAQEPSSDIEKQSKSLKEIKDLGENFIETVTVFIEELKGFEGKSRLLEQQSYSFKEKEYEILQKEKKVLTMEEDVKKEKEYVVNANSSLKERETKLLQQKDLYEELEKSKKEWEERKSEAILAEARADEKLKLVDGLNRKQKELDEQAELIEKEKEADRKRKIQLNFQAMNNKDEAARLQKIAENLAKKAQLVV